MNWDKLHRVLTTRKEGVTPIDNLVGGNKTFWAQFSRASADKLDDLIQCLVFDLRSKHPITWENECYIRMAFESLKEVIQACENEKKMEDVKDKIDQEKEHQRMKAHKLI